MDADDLMHRRRLELQLEAVRRDGALDAVGAHVRAFPRDALTEGARRYEAWVNGIDGPDALRRDAFVECPVVHPTLFARAEAMRRFGYRERGWPEDYDLVLRLLASGARIGVVPRRLLLWRERSDRAHRVDPRYAVERFSDCKAAFLAAGLLAGRDEYVLWGYGHTGRTLRRCLLRHGKRPSHIVDVHPGRVGNAIDGAPVVSPEVLTGLRGARVVASVAGSGPRERIRSFLAGVGFRETEDFVCAA